MTLLELIEAHATACVALEVSIEHGAPDWRRDAHASTRDAHLAEIERRLNQVAQADANAEALNAPGGGYAMYWLNGGEQ